MDFKLPIAEKLKKIMKKDKKSKQQGICSSEGRMSNFSGKKH